MKRSHRIALDLTDVNDKIENEKKKNLYVYLAECGRGAPFVELSVHI